jgi:hypothetical protein
MADRRVTLVLCTPDGELLGALPPFDVPTQWWQHVDDVVAGAKAVHGIDVRVLRLLTCQAPRYPGGGPVSYLAESTRHLGSTCNRGRARTHWPTSRSACRTPGRAAIGPICPGRAAFCTKRAS